MMFFRNKFLGVSFGPGVNAWGYEFYLMLIPRRDLAREGELIPSAWGLEVRWSRLAQQRGRWPLRANVWSDARRIGETVAAQAGAA